MRRKELLIIFIVASLACLGLFWIGGVDIERGRELGGSVFASFFAGGMAAFGWYAFGQA